MDDAMRQAPSAARRCAVIYNPTKVSDQFRQLVSRARTEGHVTAPMLAQIAGQARILLAR